MGAWGTGPLSNDDAQDLLDELAPLGIGARVLAVMDAFAEYEAFGLRHRDASPGAPRPDADDGSHESLRAIAAAWLVAAALERVERPARPALLAGERPGVLLELAGAARRALDAIAADPSLASNWHHNAAAWTAEVRRLHAALAPEAPSVPAGTGDKYENLEDPATLQRHNRIYRTKMLLVLAAIVVAATLMR